MQTIALAFRALSGRASEPATDFSEDISAECLFLLNAVATKGGWVEEDDEILDQQKAALLEALRKGVLTMGGGWSVGCRLTRRGRKVLDAVAPR